NFSTVDGVVRNSIARVNGDGTLDTSFGNGLAGADKTVGKLSVQSDGKIVIGGNFTIVNGVGRNSIARLNADGTLDTSFGNGLTGTNGQVNGLSLQLDGRIVIGGNFTMVNGVGRNSVARLNTDGTLDTSFLNGLAGTDSSVVALALQPDGK